MGRQPGLINFSRAGDFFHYMWVARRCLRFLDHNSDLCLVAVESVSSAEAAAVSISQGPAEDIIDVAEYYGGEAPDKADRIVYSQLKHSVQRMGQPWTPSTLAASLKGLYEKFVQSRGYAATIELQFISNRPISTNTLDLFQRLKDSSRRASDEPAWQRLKTYTGASTDSDLRDFLLILTLDDSWENFRGQQKTLQREAKAISPGTDDTISARLLEMVADKVMPDADPDIRKGDLLRALDTDIEKPLFPAPSRIFYEHDLIERKQEQDFLSLLSQGHQKVAVHAEAGLGKTALAFKLSLAIKEPSASVLYDCYGNGEYRSQLHERFGSRVAFTQIANELAAQGLCPPMIPNRSATESELLAAFLSRLRKAVLNVRIKNEEARVYLFIDAADNAQMAADEFGRPHSFARQLARETLPDGVTCVFFCWTSRLDLLDLPPSVVSAELNEFTIEESASNLRRKFPKATDNDVAEFHYLTSATPRVQAVGLSKNISLDQILIEFGPNPLSTKEAIRDLFEYELQSLRDDLPPAHRDRIDRLCRALAALRPFIPIEVLSSVSQVPVAQIRNFARNVGRPLALNNDAIQFFDEPSESWFRERYAPSATEFESFVDRLLPLAKDSAYVASALPELLHRTGRDAELVEDVLADRGLPNLDPGERRSIAIERLRFCLKSAFADDRIEDAAKLAFKLAGETAGQERYSQLIADHSHLFGSTMSAEAKVKYVARRPFDAVWHGGHFAYSAAFLSWDPSTQAEARMHLRVATFWLSEWARQTRLTKNKKERVGVSTEDATALAVATLNIEGIEPFNRYVQGWVSKERVHAISLKVCYQLADLGQWDRMDALGEDQSTGDLTRLAIAEVLFENQKLVSRETAIHLRKRLRALHRVGADSPQSHRKQSVPPFVASAIALAFRNHGLMPNSEINRALKGWAPARQEYASVWGLGEVFVQKCSSLALLQRANGEEVSIRDLLSGKLYEAWNKSADTFKHQEGASFFKLVEESIFPWCELRANLLLGDIGCDEALSKAIVLSKSTLKPSHSNPRYAEGYEGQIASLWAECIELCLPELTQYDEHATEFITWTRKHRSAMFTPSIFRIARICSRIPELVDFSYELLGSIEPTLKDSGEGVESLIEGYIESASVIYSVDRIESEIYLERVAKVAVEVGQENISRLLAILMLSEAASDDDEDRAELAYRVSRAAEHAYKFLVRDKYWQREYVINAICALSPSNAFAILARWKDRNFGGAQRLLHLAQTRLTKSSKLLPLDSAVLIGFDCGWNYVKLLRPIMSELDELPQASEELSKYVRLAEPRNVEGFDASEWDTFTDRSPLLDARKTQPVSDSGDREDKHVDPDGISIGTLSGLDLNTSEGIEEGYARIEKIAGFEARLSFAKLLFEKVPPSERLLRLEALIVSKEGGTYYLPHYLEALPPHWFEVQSFRKSCHSLIVETIHNHPEHFANFPYGKHEWVDHIENLLGIESGTLFKIALKSQTYAVEQLGPQSLFGLVNLASKVLEADQASRVLDTALHILEAQMTEDDADGPWNQSLSHDGNLEDSLAGYIWSALSSPHRDDRWEAMHAVSLSIALNRTTLQAGFLERFERGTEPAFLDRHFDERRLTADVAFLHVLRRAASLRWNLTVEVGSKLLQYWNSNDTHLLKRWLAADILLKMEASGQISFSGDVQVQLLDVCNYRRPQKDKVVSTVDDQERYYFGHDMERWVDDMKIALGLSYYDARQRVFTEMSERFEHNRDFGAGNDMRRKFGVYRGRSAWDRKYSHPETEDLDFYRTTHSIMHVAGQALKDCKLSKSEVDATRIELWLKDYLPADPSGLWRFDWRDPEPEIAWDWYSAKDEDHHLTDTEWSRTMSRQDLTTPILPTSDVPLRADLTFHSVTNRRRVEIYVKSALVSPGSKAWSLARALQSIDDPTDFRLPDADDDQSTIVLKDFILTGLVDRHDWHTRIDSIDPWGGQIRIPGDLLGEKFVDTYGLKGMEPQRVWKTANGEKFAYALRWGKSENDDRSRENKGAILAMDRKTLANLLRQEGKWLVLNRQVHRITADQDSAAWNDEIRRLNRGSHMITLIDDQGVEHYV